MSPNPQHSDQGAPSPDAPGTLGALSSDVVLEHAGWLRALARDLVRDVHEAEDLVQEVFGALAAARRPIRDLRAYLAQALRFQGAKRFRSDARRRRHEALSVDVEPEHQEPADRLAERMDAMRVVLMEVGRLPAAQARAIGLHYVDGLTVAEVAQRLGVKASTVRSQLTRGRAALRAKLDTECGGTAAWSLVFAPWCLTDVSSAGAMGLSGSPTTPTTTTAISGTAVGGLALMTLAKTLIVALPVLVAAGWFALREPEPAAVSGSAPPSTTQVSKVDLGEPGEGAVAIAAAEASPTERVSLAPQDLPGAASPAAESFPVQGRLVRASDGAPLTGVVVRLFPVGVPGPVPSATVDRHLQAVTNENGLFLVPSKTWTARSVRLVVLDDSYYLDLDLDELAFPFDGDIEVVCGPTFELRYAGEYVNPRLPARATVSYSMRTYSAGTRQGSLPWVRFPMPLPDGANELRVEAEGDFAFGHGRIDDPSGADQGPIDIEFKNGGALEFRHVDGTPPPAMRVMLRKLDSTSASPEEIHFLQRQGQTEKLAMATHLACGRYRWDLRFGTAEVGGVVDVMPGEWTRVTVGANLAATLDATVEIDVTNAPDLDWESCHIGVFLEGDPSQGTGSVPKPVASDEPGLWVLRVEDLPEGKWLLFLKAPSGYEVTPTLVPLVPGGAPSQVTVTRAAQPYPVTIRVVDAATGAPVIGATVAHMDGLNVTEVKAHDDAPGEFGPHSAPSNRSSLFFVLAEGYKLTERAFDPAHAAEANSGASTIEVRLERGWRTRVFVVNLASQAMIPGVSVHVDGQHVGETGDDGCFWLTGTEPPKELIVGRLNDELEVVMNTFEAMKGAVNPSPLGYAVMVRPR